MNLNTLCALAGITPAQRRAGSIYGIPWSVIRRNPKAWVATLRKGGGVLLPPNLVVASIGDSLEAQSVGSPVVNGFTQMDYRGCHPWARALSRQRYYHPGAASKGVGGNTLAQILARITDVTDMSIAGPDGVLVKPGTVVLEGGSNSIGQNHTAEQAIADLEGCISAIRAAGQNVVVVNVTPQDVSTTWSTTQLDRLEVLRDYIRARARPSQGVLVADAWDAIAGTPNGRYAAPGMLRDTIHWYPKAAYLVGVPLSVEMGKLFPAERPLLGTNLLTNPELAGTGGSKFAGIVGDVATGWGATCPALSGDQAITASKVDLGGGQYAQQFRITGTWSFGGDVGLNQTLPGWGTTYNIGDTVSFDGVIEVDGITPAPTSRHTPSVVILYKSGGNVKDALLGSAEPTPAATPLSLNLRIERFTHGADSTRNTPQFLYSFPAGTYDFTVRFKLPKYVKH